MFSLAVQKYLTRLPAPLGAELGAALTAQGVSGVPASHKGDPDCIPGSWFQSQLLQALGSKSMYRNTLTLSLLLKEA